jgi:hypothetical protein
MVRVKSPPNRMPTVTVLRMMQRSVIWAGTRKAKMRTAACRGKAY